MCGIAGLFLKDPSLEPELGRLTAEMLVVPSDRGPDSAGFAVYGEATPERVKLTLRIATDGADHGAVLERLQRVLGADAAIRLRNDHVVVSMPRSMADGLRPLLTTQFPELVVGGGGSRMELYKGVGRPAAVSERFGLPGMSGSHAIGHTRMATGSAITIAGAHPFSTGSEYRALVDLPGIEDAHIFEPRAGTGVFLGTGGASGSDSQGIDLAATSLRAMHETLHALPPDTNLPTLALGADAVSIDTAAMIAFGDNDPSLEDDYRKPGTTAGAYDDWHEGRDPAGITTQDPELASRLDPILGGRRLSNFLFGDGDGSAGDCACVRGKSLA